MSNINDVTGDKMVSKAPSDAYRDGWDRIFKQNKPAPASPPPDAVQDEQPDEGTES